MNWATAALLGVVQGLTEFLPVSSSAHLILARYFMGWSPDDPIWLPFDVACHVGTLIAVFAVFWKDLLRMLFAVPKALTGTPIEARRIRLIVVGSVPIVLAALLGGAGLEDVVRTPGVVAVTLALGAVWLLVAERVGTRTKTETDLTMGQAFVIGIAQAAAIVPGVSRSGATIGAGLFLGFERAEIARFTFLLSIPAILGAAGKHALELKDTPLPDGATAIFVIGIVTSGLVGYAVVKYLLRFLAAHRLDVFAWYRLVLAAGIAIWMMQ